MLGWGSSYGTIRAGVRRAARAAGHRSPRAHLHHLNPLPANLGEVLRSFERVLVPEMNSGQLAHVLRAEYLVDVEQLLRSRASRCSRPRWSRQIAGAAVSDATERPAAPS